MYKNVSAPPGVQVQQQYGQPIQAVAVPQIIVQGVQAPAGAPVLDFRSPAAQAKAAAKGKDNRMDVDQ